MSQSLQSAVTLSSSSKQSKNNNTRDGKDILNVIYETWLNDNRGQKIIGFWVGGIVVASIWGIYIKRKIRISEELKQQQKNTLTATKKYPKSFLISSKIQENSNNDDINLNQRAISLVSQDSDCEYNETPQDDDDDLIKNKKKSSFSTFKSVLDLGIPGIISSPILWSTLLSTSLIWKTSNVSSVNDSIGYMGELLVNKKWKLLSQSTISFAIKTVYASFAISTVSFLSQLLSLSLRDNITSSIMHKYNNNNNDNICNIYLSKQEIGNDIDSRISNDIKEWSNLYSNCFISFTKPIADIFIYSNKLQQRIGLFYYGQCIFYFLISSLWTRSILPSHSSMKQNLLKYESLFQNNNKRIIEYVEEIHYLNGIQTELKILDNSYCKLYNKLSTISIYDYIFEFVHNYIVRYLGILASFVSLLPMIKNEKQPTQFLLNNLHDLVNIGIAFRDLMRSSKDFQSLKGISNRIIKLYHCLDIKLKQNNDKLLQNVFILMDEDDDDDDIIVSPSNSNSKNIDIYKDDDNILSINNHYNKQKPLIIFKNITIYTPNKSKLLLKNFNFTINNNENVLIYGANGAGKSSLIRVIAGLWRHEIGGKIKLKIKNYQNDIYLLPSRSYLIPNLSIKEQLLYPDIDNNKISDETVIEILNECGLGKLVDFFNGDINNNNELISDTFWSNLSMGEKQLICLCRALIKKPKLIFIDESFSHLSNDKIDWFYQNLSKLNMTVVTISHNINYVKKYHDKMIHFIGDETGNYKIDSV